MVLDGTGTLEFKLVVVSQLLDYTGWIFRCNREVIYVDRYIFVEVIDSSHPDAWVSKGWKESHVS
jgi:hypothetical protein